MQNKYESVLSNIGLKSVIEIFPLSTSYIENLLNNTDFSLEFSLIEKLMEWMLFIFFSRLFHALGDIIRHPVKFSCML